MTDKKELLVIALGGNALIHSRSKGSYDDQLKSIDSTAAALIPVIMEDFDIVLTHGNGPQVGNILIQNEESTKKVPPMPLDVCVAESQGEIGYLIQQSLRTHLNKSNLKKDVVTIVTQVLVDLKDPAFEKPTKPVGPYYTLEKAHKLIRSKKWSMTQDPAGRGFRRVVPSPKPLHVLEARIIHQLLFLNLVPIAVGGGGIPVHLNELGNYEGIEAVIDKDSASARLAIDLKADKFIMVTNVANCYLNFKKKSHVTLREMNLDEAHTYMDQGQFSAGSMGPKVDAAIDFITNGGKEAYITDIQNILPALEKEAGTFIHH
jgi:carbamate kinase